MKSLYSLIILFLLFSCGQEQKPKNETISNNTSSAGGNVNPTTIDTANRMTKEMSDHLAMKAADSVHKQPAGSYEKADVEVKTFENKDGVAKGSWGYDIYLNKALYIHQPSMPAMPGNNGFSTEEKSRKAGGLTAYKIKHNIMPPALSPQELDSLGVLK